MQKLKEARSTETYDYSVPVQADAPWPTFRRDERNTASSPIRASYGGGAPWSFQTGKGIFSTPVITGDGTIFVGSADHCFYALNPDGTQRWRFQTGEMIDSAGALPQVDLQHGQPTIIFPSGDGHLYHVNCADGELVWQFDVEVAGRKSYNSWFEANVAIGCDGTIYAGNTNFNYYAINRDATVKWVYETGANAWSVAGFGEDGTIYWGSCDTFVHAVKADGTRKWRKRTLGFISASAAIGSNGTVYIGSFDSNFYALDPQTGRVKWKFKTGDHIYCSAALLDDEDGVTQALFFGSTDGSLYALNPKGELLWRYDTGAPIRSSPVLGCMPKGQEGQIVYFGNGNGKLYALHAGDGSRRWSFDTTSSDPELADRNDLNGSPALGEQGVYIGGEHGQVWYVPYDYPLHCEDVRASTDPGEDLPENATGMYYVTPGGRTLLHPPAEIPAASIITLRLLVREEGETVNARLHNAAFGRNQAALSVNLEYVFDEFKIESPLSFTWEQSGDGRYLHIFPEGFLEPGQAYTLSVAGNTYTGGLHIGNLTVGGRKAGRFSEQFTFKVEQPELTQPPLAVSEEKVSAFEWTRLAVPIPPMLPSLNQIGFDYMDWIVGAVAVTEPDADRRGKLILWVIGGKHDADGMLVADPDSDFTLAFNGVYQDDAFIFTNRDFNLAVTGIPIPFNIFQLRGRFREDLSVRPGASAYADTQVLSIPTFGPLMIVAGLANRVWRKLLAMATFITRPYPENGPANQRPRGVQVEQVDFARPIGGRDGEVVAKITLEAGASYPIDAHRGAILLVDVAKNEAVYLDYHKRLNVGSDAQGNLSEIRLTIPGDTRLPEKLKAFVILDVFPLLAKDL
ncbi:MAG: PQQ-like beta-propeller repeat protein [Anaerolineales bacterium]|nr:PQQ-like beta-propeller repeat protein [Anaerolineales bacterium]